MENPGLKDSFGRQITYLRLSVTDRCDLRCTYCMAENMTFLPRKDLLSLEELESLCAAFMARGVRKIRLTGGEPLVRRDVMTLIKNLSRYLDTGRLDEITLTTNGTQLSKYAHALKACGVKRINVSLDSRDPEIFATLTRRAALDQVNQAEIPDLMVWAHGKGMDMTLIEVMPLGEIETDRVDQYLPLTAVRDSLETRFTLTDIALKTGGPARYMRVSQTGGVLGMITPLTQNFCAGCNRVRVTCTGQIYMCLGQSDSVDLRAALRGPNPDSALNAALDRAMIKKPERHNFDISRRGAAPSLSRHMSVTGG